jgi:hypothetical protein
MMQPETSDIVLVGEPYTSESWLSKSLRACSTVCAELHPSIMCLNQSVEAGQSHAPGSSRTLVEPYERASHRSADYSRLNLYRLCYCPGYSSIESVFSRRTPARALVLLRNPRHIADDIEILMSHSFNLPGASAIHEECLGSLHDYNVKQYSIFLDCVEALGERHVRAVHESELEFWDEGFRARIEEFLNQEGKGPLRLSTSAGI